MWLELRKPLANENSFDIDTSKFKPTGCCSYRKHQRKVIKIIDQVLESSQILLLNNQAQVWHDTMWQNKKTLLFHFYI